MQAQTTAAAWTIYVADEQANVVRPIDAGTLTVGAPIAVGAGPQSMAITPDARTLYVANSAGGSVTPVDIATGTAAAPIVVPPGTDAGGLSIGPDGATAYVTHAGVSNSFVSPIDVATNTYVTDIPIGDQTVGPIATAVSPDGSTLRTGAVGTAVPLGGEPVNLVITPDQAPVAALTVTAGAPGAVTTFDASASTVRFGTIATYAWNFGDGTTTTTTTPTTTHVDATAGIYTATVIETSSGGTSTALQFTGQTVGRNGGDQAVASSRFLIGTLDDPGTTTTTTTTAAPGGAGATTTTIRRMTGTLPATGGGGGSDLILPATVLLIGGALALVIARRRSQI